jgi:hypothetical protein
VCKSNLTVDQNKDIGTLNNITYVYDAGGNKLQNVSSKNVFRLPDGSSEVGDQD